MTTPWLDRWRWKCLVGRLFLNKIYFKSKYYFPKKSKWNAATFLRRAGLYALARDVRQGVGA